MDKETQQQIEELYVNLIEKNTQDEVIRNTYLHKLDELNNNGKPSQKNIECLLGFKEKLHQEIINNVFEGNSALVENILEIKDELNFRATTIHKEKDKDHIFYESAAYISDYMNPDEFLCPTLNPDEDIFVEKELFENNNAYEKDRRAFVRLEEHLGRLNENGINIIVSPLKLYLSKIALLQQHIEKDIESIEQNTYDHEYQNEYVLRNDIYENYMNYELTRRRLNKFRNPTLENQQPNMDLYNRVMQILNHDEQPQLSIYRKAMINIGTHPN